MRQELAVARIRERARRVALLRWMWREVRWVWREVRWVKRTASAVLPAVTRASQKLWELAWYWRTFPVEFISLHLSRRLYGHLYKTSDEDPLVSVIIPTLDRGKLLVERTLPSIFAQTYQNFEVVIVGDHSPQETVDWISQVKDPRVRFYNLPKRGKYPQDPREHCAVAGTAPVNRARKLARGKWITHIDDDDVFTPDHIECLLRFAQRGDFEWVAGAFIEERTRGVLTHGHDPTKGWTFVTRTATSCWLWRSYLRCFKADLHSWRYLLNGDQSIKKRLIRAGVRMGFIDHVVAYKLMCPNEEFLYRMMACDKPSNTIESDRKKHRV